MLNQRRWQRFCQPGPPRRPPAQLLCTEVRACWHLRRLGLLPFLTLGGGDERAFQMPFASSPFPVNSCQRAHPAVSPRPHRRACARNTPTSWPCPEPAARPSPSCQVMVDGMAASRRWGSSLPTAALVLVLVLCPWTRPALVCGISHAVCLPTQSSLLLLVPGGQVEVEPGTCSVSVRLRCLVLGESWLTGTENTAWRVWQQAGHTQQGLCQRSWVRS